MLHRCFPKRRYQNTIPLPQPAPIALTVPISNAEVERLFSTMIKSLEASNGCEDK